MKTKLIKLVASFVILFLASAMLYNAEAQNQRTENWFDFPDRETLNSKRTVKVQYNLFIDPFGEAPNGRGGRQFGFEAAVIMGGIYVAPSVSWFPQLEDGYFDAVVSIGMTWHMFRTTAIRYYGGVRIGGEWRETSVPFGILGATLGADLRLITFKGGSSLYIGGEVWVDHRASQADQFYGDSTGYDGGTIFTNSQAKENGKIKLGFRF